MTVVFNGAVRLATTDFGGVGPSMVLMHGLGNSRRRMAKLAGELHGWRVITMDLRGHGESSTATWEFDQAVSDLAAVITHYDLAMPYVAGHSLGGMVALRYALAGLPVAGAINIDGWGPGVAERFVGEDIVRVEERLGRVGDGELPSSIARFLAARGRQGKEGTTRQVLGLLHHADVVAWHRDAPCRSLAFNAMAPAGRLLGREMARMQNAHRQGLRRDLAVLPPRVSVVEVDGGHFLHNSHTDLVAAAIQGFHA